MEIRIGIVNTPREITFETEESAQGVRDAVTAAFAKETAVLSLSDTKGNAYLVPTAALAYVQVGTEQPRHIGFVA